MRNLKQYPITVKEITDCLITFHDEINKQEACGDMRPILLEAAINIITRAGFVMHDTKLGFVSSDRRGS